MHLHSEIQVLRKQSPTAKMTATKMFDKCQYGYHYLLCLSLY